MKRREFLTISIKSIMAAGLTSAIPYALLRSTTAHAELLAAGLSDPAIQPLFTNLAPNAMSAAFKYGIGTRTNKISIKMELVRQSTGLIGLRSNGSIGKVNTPVWGYGADDDVGSTWPGRTFERHIKDAPLTIEWTNNLLNVQSLPLQHLLPVDTSLHWCYSLLGYQNNSIAKNGVPLVPHVHGGRNDSAFDGNPEYFFSPDTQIKGPRFVSRTYKYGGPDWNNKAGMLWYHDHALGITRLNVYAGLAGFFALRDNDDTGKSGNPAGLPADPYELGYAVQDRMFRNTGELFYPAFPGDPSYADFIDGEGVILDPNLFPNGGPTALAEFFGDHMLVNGVIWPKASVEPRQYRIRFLNGCDSRFMRIKLKVIPGGASNSAATDPSVGSEIPFFIVGSDQSLCSTAHEVSEVDFLPGERLDLVIDFKNVNVGDRVIVENILGDVPFGGDLPEPTDLFPGRRTDRVMAFDVELPLNTRIPDTNIGAGYLLGGGSEVPAAVVRTRKLALFEGSDNYGRLQPLLGTAEPVVDIAGNSVTGALPWFSPITENPQVGDTEIWEFYNSTGDAHPIHVHLVHFEVLNREGFSADMVSQAVAQHDGSVGVGARLENIVLAGNIRGPENVEDSRRDMVMALPGEVTRIKMTFDKPGRYVWHCHILSHEDHEMMRPFHVGAGPF